MRAQKRHFDVSCTKQYAYIHRPQRTRPVTCDEGTFHRLDYPKKVVKCTTSIAVLPAASDAKKVQF